MSDRPIGEIEFLRKLQRLLAEGDFVATYKFALLNALADLSLERDPAAGVTRASRRPRELVTSRQPDDRAPGTHAHWRRPPAESHPHRRRPAAGISRGKGGGGAASVSRSTPEISSHPLGNCPIGRFPPNGAIIPPGEPPGCPCLCAKPQ